MWVFREVLGFRIWGSGFGLWGPQVHKEVCQVLIVFAVCVV